jgi:hypothetical protein
MTDIARYDGDRAAAVRPDAPALEQWAAEMQAAAQIARALAGTPFVPASLRVFDDNEQPDLTATTANIAAALLTGKELGLQPMSSLRSIDVIDGTPALRALTMRALVRARGHELWLVESTKTRCIYRGRTAGTDKIEESVWTIDRARDLGLVGKRNWRTQPQNMLIARATAEICRLVGPEALLGLPYSIEELEDGGDATEPGPAAPVPDTPGPRRTARRRNPPPPRTGGSGDPAPAAEQPAEDEPPLEETRPAPAAAPYLDTSHQPPTTEAPVQPAADETSDDYLITDAQLRALHAGFRDLGITDRADRLALTCQIIGRQISSANDLYLAEASVVIDELMVRKTRAAQNPDDDPFRDADG